MPLIKCPECGREISSFAKECIGCGCPMSKIQEILNSENNSTVEEKESIKKEKKFFAKLNNDQKNFIISVNSALSIDYKEDNIIDLIEEDNCYTYRLINNPKIECKFVLGDSGVLYFNAYEYSKAKAFVVTTEFNRYDRGKVIRIFDKLLGKYEPDIYVKAQKEKGSIKDKHYFRIFPLIKKEMNDKYYEGSIEDKELCKNIRTFVLSIMSIDAGKSLVCVTWASPHHPFFGNMLKWDTGDGWRSTSIVYFYYKASKVLEKINEYERIFNEKIIVDTSELLKSLYKQFDDKEEISVGACNGVNSNIADVPDTVIQNTLKQFDQFE